jgi:molybdenum cofactor cytidylyltransferase
MMSDPGLVGAVVLAAGQSRRMGRPKLLMPWGERTVIEQVVKVLLDGAATPVVVVSGGTHEQIAEALRAWPVQIVHNPRYQENQMALSLRAGLAAMPAEVQAVLVALGDQPQIESSVVQAVIEAYRLSQARLVVPSYQMRRGHPWLAARPLWSELLGQQPVATLRDFLSTHASEIHYLPLDKPSILQDLDTPDDYARQAPSFTK